MKIFLNDFDKIPQVQRNGIYEVENTGIFHYLNGKLHREEGPAESYIDGYKSWYINGELHRLDGPAIKWNGYYEYWIKDKQYSKKEFDKVAYLYKNGLFMKISYNDWMKIPIEQRNGIYEVENIGTFYHREDGPAFEHINGNKFWFVNDKYHRLDGPAFEDFDGYEKYYIEGKRYHTKEEFETAVYMYKNGLQDYL